MYERLPLQLHYSITLARIYPNRKRGILPAPLSGVDSLELKNLESEI